MKKSSLAALLLSGLLSACASITAMPQIDGEWQLTTINGMDVRGDIKGDKIVIFDSGKKQYKANVGCNNLFGSLDIDGTKMVMGPAASTRMACAENAMLLDQKTITSFTQTQSYKIEYNELRLLDANGKTLTRWLRR
jgi:heat shock protein HslJ